MNFIDGQSKAWFFLPLPHIGTEPDAPNLGETKAKLLTLTLDSDSCKACFDIYGVATLSLLS